MNELASYVVSISLRCSVIDVDLMAIGFLTACAWPIVDHATECPLHVDIEIFTKAWPP